MNVVRRQRALATTDEPAHVGKALTKTSKNPRKHLPLVTHYQCWASVPLIGLQGSLKLLPPNRRHHCHHFCQQSETGAGIEKLWILLLVGQESSNSQFMSIRYRFHGLTASAALRTDFFNGSFKRHVCGRVITARWFGLKVPRWKQFVFRYSSDGYDVRLRFWGLNSYQRKERGIRLITTTSSCLA